LPQCWRRALQNQGRLEKAERLLQKAVPVLRDAGPGFAPMLCNAIGNLGAVLRNANRHAETE
jgi:aspartate/glutamate racemase